MLRKFLLFVSCALYLVPCAFSQAPQTWTSADMYLALRKLNVLGSVLYVAAHPDDDNARLIGYLSKETLYRTGYLSLTRGDGGQNLIGDEQGIELGLIRTQELLASRKIDGGEQFFSRAYDFGYSKNPEETFTKWDREKILSDVVWVIRKFQPDVVITRFPTTGEGGHGHHTASAILANDAYTAAADPNRFPEQLKYVKTWQVKRVLWNTFNFGSTNTTANDQFKMDDGGYNPLLGKSYGEIGAASRSQNRTQGTGSTSFIGTAIEYFKTTRGDPPVNDLMDGVDVSWKRVKGGQAIEKMVNDLIGSFDLLHPANSVKGLVNLYQALLQLPDGYWKTQKLKEVQQLIEQCSGLFIDATSSQPFAVQTDSARINFFLNNRLGVNAMLKEISLDAFDSSFTQSLAKNVNVSFGKFFFVPGSKPITQPYWLDNKMEEGYFNVKDQQKIGQADVDAAYMANITLNIEGQDFIFPKAVKYKFTDPVRGEVYQPFVVLPAVAMKTNPRLTIGELKDTTALKFDAVITSYKNRNSVSIKKRTTNEPIYSAALNRNETKTVALANRFNPSVNGSVVNNVVIIDSSDYLDKDNNIIRDMHAIQYDHIPQQTYFTRTEEVSKWFSLKTVGKKIGYIVGAGDKVPEALEQMGYDVTLLGDKELSRNNLQQFDAIITGVRAYNTDQWLNKYYSQLMNYVNAGGNMIVQYNRNTNAGPLPQIGPYKFDISGNRVTDENAEVNFSNPNHSVLHYPNEITQNDFKGWIQERSIYHAGNFDKNNFETVFSMHDPGENNDEGSLIIAKYGKGTFVYTGLVFFRELPAGVPGAYRLFANLIALNKQKAF
jgi:LmbE family N-acetylglucosaminyl deacetylase